MPNRRNIATLFAVLLTAVLGGFAEARAPDGFVTVEDGHFSIDGRAYAYAGTNYWHGAYLGHADPERLVRELDFLRDNGITNLRVLALSELSELSRSVKPAFITSPGTYNEKLLRGLDRLLVEMAKRDMKAVLYLTNFWQWSGGMSQYLAWHNGGKIHDPDVDGEWNQFMDKSAGFYRCAPCQKQYRQAIAELTSRTNHLTGKKYRDDPTIMSWQLANEPRPGSDASYSEERAQSYIGWINDTAKAIKQLAPRQLVSSGSEGIMGSQQRADLYTAAHDTPYIDYLTVHLWIKNWSWFDINDPDSTYPEALRKSRDYLQQHIEIAGRLDKPLVLEEFGVERDGGSYSPEASTKYRDRFLGEIYALIEKNHKEKGPFSGSNFWTFAGYGRAASADAIWKTGDPFLGDPPQEPQGLNSVFDSDTSTLAIISGHADRIAEITTLARKSNAE
ncbi:glycoside hydrolase 5 family protein [Microbulbifer sp.]|uniref:glycoside hydrolase 5 family protein n=1 Tax=Microbulbifer sp. TaxID=1908541 RepID=UPI003F34F6D7